MKSEVSIYKEQYIKIDITTTAGTETIYFSNREVRGKVEFSNGVGTQIFVSEDGGVTSLETKEPKYFKFTLRAYEGTDTRIKYEKLKVLCKGWYSGVFTFNYFISQIDGLPDGTNYAEYTGSAVQVVGFSNAVFKILPDPVDNTFRGEGTVKEEVEIIAYEHTGISFVPENVPTATITSTGNDYTGVDLNGLSSTDGGCTGGITGYAWDVPGYTEGTDYDYVTGTSTSDTIKLIFYASGTYPVQLVISTGTCGTSTANMLVEFSTIDVDGDFNNADFLTDDFFTDPTSGLTIVPTLVTLTRP